MVMGQAAGTAAQIAIKRRELIVDIDIAELQKQLKADGAILF